MVSTMLKEMEHLFATRFGTFSARPSAAYLCITNTWTSHPERGNRKKAKDYLRVEPLPRPQRDFSTFGFGLWLGLALPAAAAGCYLCRSLF